MRVSQRSNEQNVNYRYQQRLSKGALLIVFFLHARRVPHLPMHLTVTLQQTRSHLLFAKQKILCSYSYDHAIADGHHKCNSVVAMIITQFNGKNRDESYGLQFSCDICLCQQWRRGLIGIFMYLVCRWSIVYVSVTLNL